MCIRDSPKPSAILPRRDRDTTRAVLDAFCLRRSPALARGGSSILAHAVDRHAHIAGLPRPLSPSLLRGPLSPCCHAAHRVVLRCLDRRVAGQGCWLDLVIAHASRPSCLGSGEAVRQDPPPRRGRGVVDLVGRSAATRATPQGHEFRPKIGSRRKGMLGDLAPIGMAPSPLVAGAHSTR